jgi:O-antigen biosynthesis protein
MQPTASLKQIHCGLDFGREVESTSGGSLIHYEGEASSPEWVVEGWMLGPPDLIAQGVRLRLGSEIIVARRKQLRPDVMRLYPERAEALHSGFKASVVLKPGRNLIFFQFKDEAGTWNDFMACTARLSRFWKLRQALGSRAGFNAYEAWFSSHMALSKKQIGEQRELSKSLPTRPTLSLLIRIGKRDEKDLRQTIKSVLEQTYSEWQIHLIVGSSESPSYLARLAREFGSDPRVCPTLFPDLNAAFTEASGDFFAILESGNTLTPDALFEMAKSISNNGKADVILCDEDQRNEKGRLSAPSLRMGVNYDLLLHQNCFGQLVFFRNSLIREMGAVRNGTEGLEVWDLSLRAIERAGVSSVSLIPRVLYHKLGVETKNEVSFPTGFQIVRDHLAKVAPEARVELLRDGEWKIIWPIPDAPPKVSIIMPTRNRLDLVKVSVESLFKVTEYPNFELIVVNHQSDEPDILGYFEEIKSRFPGTRIPRVEGPFNWAKLNNVGVREASGEIVLFLNNDVEINEPGWLTEMVAQVCRARVGAVGACLFFPEGSIQHAGVVLNLGGIAGHIFRRARLEAESIGGSSQRVREVTAVTGACMAVRKEVFEQAGGFDEVNLPISYNDIDFCLKLRSLGYRNIYTSFARMVHHESVSRAEMEKESARKDAATEEARIVLNRWPDEFKRDAFFNPNLTTEIEWPTLRT